MIRALYEERIRARFPPTEVAHPTLPLKAKLDGQNPALNKLIEIKASSKWDFDKAKLGGIPREHYAQVQAQLWIAGVASADYVSYFAGQIAIVPVSPDSLLIQNVMSPLTHWFWDCLANKRPAVDEDRPVVWLALRSVE